MNKQQKELIKKLGLVKIKPLEKRDKDGNLVYKKYSDGREYKYKDGNLVYRKYSDGTEYYAKFEDGNIVYEKYSDGRYYIDGEYYEKGKKDWEKMKTKEPKKEPEKEDITEELFCSGWQRRIDNLTKRIEILENYVNMQKYTK